MLSKAFNGKKPVFRLQKRRQFQQVYKTEQKIPLQHVVIFFKYHNDNDEIIVSKRVGITVTKRIGNAVIRNKIKRRFREIFRRLEPVIVSGIDLVFVAKRGVEKTSFADLLREIENGLREHELLNEYTS